MAEAVTERRQVKGKGGTQNKQVTNRGVTQDRQMRGDTGETKQLQNMYSPSFAFHDMIVRITRLLQVAHMEPAPFPL